MHRAIALFLGLALLAPAVLAGDLEALIDGVGRIGAPGVPGPLSVYGREAFVVATGGVGRSQRAAVVAAARWGRGRVVAFGHGGYFGREALAAHDTARLVENAVRWAAGDRVGRVVVWQAPALAAELQRRGFDVAADADLKGADVLCVDAHRLGDRGDAVRAFVRRGGGLLTAGLGWGWKQLNPGRDLPLEHPGNALLADAGLVWADGTLGHTAEGGYAVDAAAVAGTHAADALAALEGGDPDADGQAGWTVLLAARSLPPGDKALRPALERLRRRHGKAALPPLGPRRVLERLSLALDLEEIARTPPADVRAHPAAAVFPGEVPRTAARVARDVVLDPARPGWHSTGLHAAPGERIVVEGPSDRRYAVRIGAHTDGIWHHPTWKRAPEVSVRVAADGGRATVACAFGGLVYLEPWGGGGPAGDPFPVKVRGAVEAPLYVHGATDLEDWRKSIRHRPAPWAELATEKVILTVPAEHVRGLDDPAALMDFWDRVLDAAADLAARPRTRARPERYVADVQISAGYMHAGYPIMTHLDAAARMVDLGKMRKGEWGLFHELGHNHQHPDWTFAGTGEVTCNLFTLYLYDKVCGVPPSGHERLNGKAREEMLGPHFAGGADFDHWKAKPFLALVMYMQLLEAFGWEPFEAVFAEYRDLLEGDRPKHDGEKRDQWMVRFGRRVGKDLGPFFEAWNVPVSKEARAALAGLDPWMPDAFPPR